MSLTQQAALCRAHNIIYHLAFTIFLFQVQFVDSKSTLQESTASFCVDIPGTFLPGNAIKITGVPASTAKWLFINLRTGCIGTDGPLHMSFMFDNSTVFRRVLENGIWENEEILTTFPFVKESEFELLIEVDQNLYTVSANGAQLFTLPRLQPYTAATKLEMNGGRAFIRKVELINQESSDILKQMIYPIPLSKPVYRPSFPFWGIFPKKLEIGNTIVVEGYFPAEISRTNINLCAADCSTGPVVLHLDARFSWYQSVRQSVRSSYVKGWIPDGESDSIFPFHCKEPFIVTIQVLSDGYNIGVNNVHYWKYAHRVPFDQVETMSIEMGYMDIWKVELLDKFEQVKPSYPPVSQSQACDSFLDDPSVKDLQQSVCPKTTGPPVFKDISNMTVPFAYPIEGGIRSGMMIYIDGIPSTNFKWFSISLQCDCEGCISPDVAFSFDANSGNATVVRNSRRHGCWEDEENAAPYFPFRKSVPFSMIVYVGSDKYKVAINRCHFVEFYHRMYRFYRINELRIKGDVNITSVRISV